MIFTFLQSYVRGLFETMRIPDSDRPRGLDERRPSVGARKMREIVNFVNFTSPRPLFAGAGAGL